MASHLQHDIPKIPVTIIIMTQDENKNIGACLGSLVNFFDDIWLVDSYSEDKTVQIAQKYGVHIISNHFTHWATQRNWALKNAQIRHDWIFFLDADEQVTPQFCLQLQAKISEVPHAVGAMNVKFQYYFLGRPIHFAYESPPVLRIIRKGRAVWEGEGAREYAQVDGSLVTINPKLIHWDRKGLAAWTAKHIKNAQREVRLLQFPKETKLIMEGTGGKTHERPGRRFLREQVWNRLPRLVRPFAYFIYRYVLRGGFLDGKAGFAYCFLHGLWYPLLIDLMIEENKTT